MEPAFSRRALLRTGLAAGAVGIAGCRTRGDGTPSPGADPPVAIRGAIYLPSRAFNTYQMWWRYDRDVVERDLGYAATVHLNAIRTWVSYEWWREAPRAHATALEHFLTTAAENGLRVYVELFESVGSDVAREYLRDTNPETAIPVASPSRDIMRDQDRWDEPRAFVQWFMDRYRDDDRLLAVSPMNEPGWNEMEMSFAEGMFETLLDTRGTVPLTVGATSLINSVDYLDWGADILQEHYNFPRSPAQLRHVLEDAVHVSAVLERPVWLTEWQRVRPSGGGFSGGIEGDEWQPNYASLAPEITATGVGSFFWSLMVKPGYTPDQRALGTITGLFHEDGAVWSLDDARSIAAMSGDPHYEGVERPEKAEWMDVEWTGPA